MAIYENKYKQESINKLKLEIFEDIKQIKQYIHEFNRENNIQFAKDAVTLFISQLSPKIEEHRRLNYPIMNVDTSNKKCKLVQKRIDYVVTENDRAIEEHNVVEFKIGMGAEQQSKNRSKKDNQNNNLSKSSSSEFVLT